MSDALTDLERDKRLGRIWNRIAEKEKEFYKTVNGVSLSEPQREKLKRLAGELLDLWKEYHTSPSGYWSSPNNKLSLAKIGFYHKFLQKGELPLEVFPYPVELSGVHFLIRAKEGHGSWMGSDLENILSTVIYRQTGRDDAVKIQITEDGQLKVSPLYCKDCPFLFNNLGCGLAYYHYVDGRREKAGLCRGFDEISYNKRKEAFKKLMDTGKNEVF